MNTTRELEVRENLRTLETQAAQASSKYTALQSYLHIARFKAELYEGETISAELMQEAERIENWARYRAYNWK